MISNRKYPIMLQAILKRIQINAYQITARTIIKKAAFYIKEKDKP